MKQNPENEVELSEKPSSPSGASGDTKQPPANGLGSDVNSRYDVGTRLLHSPFALSSSILAMYGEDVPAIEGFRYQMRCVMVTYWGGLHCRHMRFTLMVCIQMGHASQFESWNATDPCAGLSHFRPSCLAEYKLPVTGDRTATWKSSAFQ